MEEDLVERIVLEFISFSVINLGVLAANTHEITEIQIPQIKHKTPRIVIVILNRFLIFAIFCYLITCI